MTFSRAQMIEAYLAGSRERKKYAKVPDHDAAFRYVDSLQEATPGLSDALGSDDLPGYRPTLNPEIERLDTILREHILKSQERELVLAKATIRLFYELVMRVQFQSVRGIPDAPPVNHASIFGELLDHFTAEIHKFFPELTQEE